MCYTVYKNAKMVINKCYKHGNGMFKIIDYICLLKKKQINFCYILNKYEEIHLFEMHNIFFKYKY